jgi:ubiquinone/menaquinone biosynthesis C-methylase UbiE
MQTEFAAGLHVPAEGVVDSSAYDQWVGRWSRLFVPAVLAAGDLRPGLRVLDVSTGTGEASLAIIPRIGSSGLLVGVDIAAAMLQAARGRLTKSAFLPVAADGQALPFADASFDAVVCQLGLQFFPDPGRGLMEFRRVLRDGGRVGICVISTPDQAPMWGILADVLGRAMPGQRDVTQLSFALADSRRLEHLLTGAGFRDVHIERQSREGAFDSLDDYWAPIEAGTGLIPQVYLSLPESQRRAVRDEVTERLAKFQSDGRLVMSVEMLIASGRA